MSHENLMLEPCVESQEAFHPIEPLTGNEDRTTYLARARDRLCQFYESLKIPFTPQKTLAHFLLQELNIGDQETWIIPATDYESIENVIGAIISRGRKKIWIGTIIRTDFADPNAPIDREHPREHAHLFLGPRRLGINSLDDLSWQYYIGELDPNQDDNIMNITQYHQKHPELVLKIFPQDLPDLSIGRLIYAPDGLTIQIIKSEYSARENDHREKPITIFIRHSPIRQKPWLIFAPADDIHYLKPIINSIINLVRLESSARAVVSDLSLLNPEFMINNLGTSDASIRFFTDCIWGTQKSGQQNTYAPIRKIINAIPKMPCLPESYMPLLNWPNINYESETVSRLLREASSGNPPQHSYRLLLEIHSQIMALAQDLYPELAQLLSAFAKTSEDNTYFYPGSRPNFRHFTNYQESFQSALDWINSHYGIKLIINKFPQAKHFLGNDTN